MSAGETAVTVSICYRHHGSSHFGNSVMALTSLVPQLCYPKKRHMTGEATEHPPAPEQIETVDCIECAGGVLVRDRNRCALFHPAEMRAVALHPPGGLTAEETARLVEADPGLLGPRTNTQPSEGKAGTPSLLPVFSSKPNPARQVGDARRHLHRLTLHLSNACNLACEYCYEGATHSGGEGRLMDMATLRTVLERVFELYESVEVVQFYGGEPLMHLQAIDLAGELLTRAVEQKRLRAMPHLAATTNGTWIDGAALASLRRWKIALTVSWDGPRAVHDAARPMQSGGGSYELVAAGIERLKRFRIPFDIQCTYNGYHQRDGISLLSLMDFFWRETGKPVMQIVPAFLPQPGECQLAPIGAYVDLASLAGEYRAATSRSLENLMRGSGPMLEYALRAARRLATRSGSDGSCPAFHSQLAVAVDGSVYPCHLLAGVADFYMGSLVEDAFPGEDAKAALARYHDEMANRDLPWFSRLLEGCAAGEAILTGSLAGKAFDPIAEAIAEECVLTLARD
jgi:uncharacterized protein